MERSKKERGEGRGGGASRGDLSSYEHALAQAFVVEAVNLGDLPALVISAKDVDSVPEADLEAHQERHRFDRVVTTILRHKDFKSYGLMIEAFAKSCAHEKLSNF